MEVYFLFTPKKVELRVQERNLLHESFNFLFLLKKKNEKIKENRRYKRLD